MTLLYGINQKSQWLFLRNAIKQYNNLKVTRKSGDYIRTETTINNPKSLGLQKPVLFLQACLWCGLGCNNRLLNCCADVDVSTICDGETDPFDHPVLDHKERKVTPPDLRKDRQLALCHELLKPKYTVHGFKTADLKHTLNQFFSNSAKIRYEMRKLLVRGAIKKQKKSFYRVKPDYTGSGGEYVNLKKRKFSHVFLKQSITTTTMSSRNENPFSSKNLKSVFLSILVIQL